jgi:hypothetical protein
VYRASEVEVLGVLESEFPKLDAQLQDPDSPLNDHLSGYSAEERDTIKKGVRKWSENIKFSEAFPRENAQLPAVIVEEREQTETEQHLGTMGDVSELEGKGVEVFIGAFTFRRTVGIEIVAHNKDEAKHLTVLIRFIMLSNRIAFDALGMRNQRLQTINGITREVSDFPEEAFVRTIMFGFTLDEEIKVETQVPVITDIDVECEGSTQEVA